MKVAVFVVWLLAYCYMFGHIAAFVADPTGEPEFPLILLLAS